MFQNLDGHRMDLVDVQEMAKRGLIGVETLARRFSASRRASAAEVSLRGCSNHRTITGSDS